MKDETRFYVYTAFLVGIGIIIGILIHMSYMDMQDKRAVDGLRMGGYSETQAKAKAYQKDSHGDWVCVNVHNMRFDRALEVCKHEVGHEIFAEVCEKDFDKCLGVLNDEEIYP